MGERNDERASAKRGLERCRSATKLALISGLLALAWLLPACDEPGSPDGGAGSGNTAGAPSSHAGSGPSSPSLPKSVDDFFEQEGRLICERFLRCFSPRDDDRVLPFLFGSQQACEAEVVFVNHRSASVTDVRARVASGELALAPATALACLQELASCSEADSLNEGSCREVFEGKVDEAGACQRDEDCAGDAYCAGELSCPGQCKPRGLPGAACTRPQHCAYRGSPVDCIHPSGSVEGECRELERVEKVGLGAQCVRSLQNAEAFVLCQDELWCAPLSPDDTSGLGHCQRPIEGEGACSDQDDVCLIGLCNTSLGKCQALSFVGKEGAACSDAQQLFCNPLLGLKCSDDELGGTCLKQGDGSKGSECFTGDFQRGCEAGLYCSRPVDATSGTCVMKLGPGEPCESSNECASGDCNTTCQERYCGL
ncbi:MAG TPA: hypothetical protein VIW29_07245 [Polyangiaceae bacterium]